MTMINGIRVPPGALRAALGGRKKLSAFNQCVGGKLFGTHPGKDKVRAEFIAAAKECKGTKNKKPA